MSGVFRNASPESGSDEPGAGRRLGLNDRYNPAVLHFVEDEEAYPIVRVR